MLVAVWVRAWALAAVLASAHAQYFSDGWKPGQQVTTALPPESTYDPTVPVESDAKPIRRDGFLNSLLTSGPLGSLFTRIGINVTERLEEARIKEANRWDSRIPLVSDTNYDELIVKEELTPAEEHERVWFMIITIAAGQKEGISALFDSRFDEAYDLTAKAGDLPHVKWGRIDYMNVTRITTKWNVWRGPVIVMAMDRGKTLRFLNARYIRPQPELMRKFLEEKQYLEIPPWESSFGPGGKREFVLDWLAVVFEKWFLVSTRVPRWIMYIITGGLASVLIQFMHRGTTPKPVAKTLQHDQHRGKSSGTGVSGSDSTTTATTSGEGARKRGGRK